MKELRCDCGKLICKFENAGKIESKCPRCKEMVIYDRKKMEPDNDFEFKIKLLESQRTKIL